jgi:hypothetical protein
MVGAVRMARVACCIPIGPAGNKPTTRKREEYSTIGHTTLMRQGFYEFAIGLLAP